jgi:hypothetical protein
MPELTLQSVVSGGKKIVSADLDGDTVMMSVEAGKYYNLGEIGGVIWGMISEPITVEALVERLLEKYNVTKEQCETETLFFLGEMEKEGLLEAR